MTELTVPEGLAAEFVALNDHLRTGGNREAMFHRVVQLVVDSTPSCDQAAIAIWPPGRAPRTLACAGDIAGSIDALQYEFGQGPWPDAAAGQAVVQVPDLAADDRWPAFVAAALSCTPVRGLLSVHLGDEPHRCVLSLYTPEPGAFDAGTVNLASLYAAHARVLLAHVASTDKIVNLERALTTSRQIGAAIGILMNAHRITQDDAFALLRESSQHLHRKLRSVADDVTTTGALPEA